MNKAFKVRYQMASPIVARDGIRLDALIMKLYLEEVEVDLRGVPVTETWKYVDLPLKKVGFGSDKFYYAASHGLYEAKVVYKDRFFKRIDTMSLLQNAGIDNVNTGSGKFCSAINEFEEIHVDYVEFYGVGEVDKCEELLSRVSSLGGLRKQGKGLVNDFEFEVLDKDMPNWGCWLGNVAVRNIPVQRGEVSRYLGIMRGGGEFKLNLIQARIVPPYHYRCTEGKEMCLGIGSEIAE